MRSIQLVCLIAILFNFGATAQVLDKDIKNDSVITFKEEYFKIGSKYVNDEMICQMYYYDDSCTNIRKADYFLKENSEPFKRIYYYLNGRIMSIETKHKPTKCVTGIYQDSYYSFISFFENGQIESMGRFTYIFEYFDKLADNDEYIMDTLLVYDSLDNSMNTRIQGNNSKKVKSGTWLYFSENGVLARKEEY